MRTSIQPLPNLPASLSRQIFHDLTTSLPPPAIDTPEALEERDDIAMDSVAALLPSDTFEAWLATQIVAANAHAMECLRRAVQPDTAPEDVVRNRNQASAMMRNSQSGLRALRRDQAMREKAIEACRPAAMERAGYWFHEITVPTEAPAPIPAQTPPHAPAEAPGLTLVEAPPPANNQPPTPIRAESARPTPDKSTPPDPIEPEIHIDYAAEAELYAAIYPDRARLIRSLGGLPRKLTFGPPDPEMVEAIITGTGPNLSALDPEPATAARA